MSDCSQQAWHVPAEREPGVLYMHGHPGTDYAAVDAIEVDGNRFIRSTGIENDMFFILPKPKERVAYYGKIERVEDDGSLKMYQSVQLVDEALKRWQGQIEDDIQRRLFETFAKPQEDENGAYVMVDGQRFERVRTCHLEETVHQREIASEFGGGYYEETTHDCDECGFENADYNIRFCGGCGAKVVRADD